MARSQQGKIALSKWIIKSKTNIAFTKVLAKSEICQTVNTACIAMSLSCVR